MPTNAPYLGATIHAQNIGIRVRVRQFLAFIFYTIVECDYILARRRSINGLDKNGVETLLHHHRLHAFIQF